MPQNQGGALRGETPQRGVAEDLRSKAEARGEASPPPLDSPFTFHHKTWYVEYLIATRTGHRYES